MIQQKLRNLKSILYISIIQVITHTLCYLTTIHLVNNNNLKIIK